MGAGSSTPGERLTDRPVADDEGQDADAGAPDDPKHDELNPHEKPGHLYRYDLEVRALSLNRVLCRDLAILAYVFVEAYVFCMYLVAVGVIVLIVLSPEAAIGRALGY